MAGNILTAAKPGVSGQLGLESGPAKRIGSLFR